MTMPIAAESVAATSVQPTKTPEKTPEQKTPEQKPVEQKSPEKKLAETPATKNNAEDVIDAAEHETKLAMMKGQSMRNRRGSIRAESVSASAAMSYVKPVYEKSSSSVEKLKEIVTSNPKLKVVFGTLEGSSLEDVLNAFQEKQAPAGTELIKQGDQGDCLYIISSGKVDVYVVKPGPNGKLPNSRGDKVVTLGAGALFGELALMYTAPRAATVVTADTVSLWQLDREPFKMLSVGSATKKQNQYEAWLHQVELLKPLLASQITALGESLSSQRYKPGDIIMKQGDIGDRFYILEEGNCAAFVASPRGTEKQVMAYSKQGDSFGELALLQDEPRKATIRATGSGALVAFVEKENFINLLGPAKEVLMKQQDKYEQFKDLLK